MQQMGARYAALSEGQHAGGGVAAGMECEAQSEVRGEGSAIQRRRRLGVVAALALGLGLVVVCWPSHIFVGVMLRSRLGAELQDKEEYACGNSEQDIDYWTRQPLFSLLDVASAEACRDQCQAHPECYTWTWGSAHGIRSAWHAYHTCFLKARSAGEVKRYTEVGVVSGIACRTEGGAGVGVPAPAPPPAYPQPSADPGAAAGAAAGAPGGVAPALETPTGDQYMKMPIQGGDLFCFALMLPLSVEPVLLAMQLAEQQSLFACDQAAVYSNRPMQVGPKLVTIVVDVDLHCEFGGEFKTALNKEIFDAVWQRILNDGVFKFYSWTVKVDPDCVFFPGRLTYVLSKYTPGPNGIYLNNCHLGMHGPLEVLSSRAVEIWVGYEDQCNTHFEKLCSGDCKWGEDMFMDQCLQKVLNVKRKNEYQLLIEDHCDPPEGWRACSSASEVAFHPFKTKEEYQTCLEASAQSAGYSIHPAYAQAAAKAAGEAEARVAALKASMASGQASPAPAPGYPAPAPAYPAAAYPAPAQQ